MQRLLHAIELFFGDKADRVAGVIYVGADQKLVFVMDDGTQVEGLAGLDARFAPKDDPYVLTTDAGTEYLTPAQLDGAYIRQDSATNGWISPAYQNGWGTYAAATDPPAQYRMRHGNVVELRGLVGGGTPQDSETGTGVIFTLPAGFRPSTRVILPALSNENAARLDVFASGNVVAATTAQTWGASSWFILSGSFYVG